MLSCKQASQMMSQKLDRPLSTRERTALWLHLSMCSGCRKYNEQMKFMRKVFMRLKE
ncbi:MAG: zf-HC2 domain-containing protein [Chromatiales bacterium]|nr:zf-HC2 domain-containing protein [Gammaproteobacteria bacterium]MBW6475811.1 zf-HC2 domain-containing protein [Chromatiales bacterium]